MPLIPEEDNYTLPEIMIPNTYYRKDIGDRVNRELAELEKRGYGFNL